jgi:hypothetical protein
MLIVLAGVGVALLWIYYHSISYSLAQAAEAIRLHDMEQFEKYVDVESVASSALDSIMAYSARRAGIKTDDLGGLASGMMMLLKPQAIAAFRGQVRSAIEGGNMQVLKNGQGGFLADLWNQNNGQPVTEIETLWREGKIALARVTLTPKGAAESRFDLKLRQREGHWQVIELANVEELLANSETSQKPAHSVRQKNSH